MHTFLSLSYSISSGLCLWIRALKARPSFQLGEESKGYEEATRRNVSAERPWAPTAMTDSCLLRLLSV